MFGRVVAPAGVWPSAVLPGPGAIPITTQWTYNPAGASGSSTTSAAPSGADHQRRGDAGPLQVYRAGIGAPSANAGLLIVNGPPAGASGAVLPSVVTFGAGDDVGWLSPSAPQPTSALTASSRPAAPQSGEPRASSP